jgi:hypothetical protein
MRPKRNESGQALILTICVISLAVSITLYAFLAGTATSRENVRLSASKIDVSQREDVLMRAILHKTAEGMLAGQTWDTILNSALSEMRASSYIDPSDLTVLFPGQNIVPANLADSNAGASAFLPGFTGTLFTGLIPYAGTTGVQSATPYAAILPPLLQYPGGSSQETADRTAGQDPVTSPHYLFFKALYSTANTSTPTALSTSNRWGQLTYPNIRFGLEHPGDTFIARRVWWPIQVQFTSSSGGYVGSYNLGNQQGYAAQNVKYILSVYDFPSQLPIKVSGSVNAVIGQEATSETWGNTSTSSTGNVKIDGSIYGDSVQLNGSTFTGNISARRALSVQQSSTVGSETFSDNTYADLGARETKDTTRGIGAPPVSVSGDGGKVLLTSLASGDNFLTSATTPTPWDLYSRPYYRCPVRIIVSYVGPVSGTGAGNITLKVEAQKSPGKPDALVGVPDPATGDPLWTVTTYSKIDGTASTTIPNTNGALQFTTTATGDPNGEMNLLQIDLSKLPGLVGLTQATMYAVYAGYQPDQPLSTNGSLAISLVGTKDLSAFTSGFSIVTKQRLYFQGDFNQVKLTTPLDPDLTDDQYPPTSIYAQEVRYGVNQVMPTLNFQGRLDLDQSSTSTATQINPLAAASGSNTPISFSQRQFNLLQIKHPKMVPPITRLNLLFTIEKEYTQ